MLQSSADSSGLSGRSSSTPSRPATSRDMPRSWSRPCDAHGPGNRSSSSRRTPLPTMRSSRPTPVRWWSRACPTSSGPMRASATQPVHRSRQQLAGIEDVRPVLHLGMGGREPAEHPRFHLQDGHAEASPHSGRIGWPAAGRGVRSAAQDPLGQLLRVSACIRRNSSASSRRCRRDSGHASPSAFTAHTGRSTLVRRATLA